jgi:hypothetical protein
MWDSSAHRCYLRSWFLEMVYFMKCWLGSSPEAMYTSKPSHGKETTGSALYSFHWHSLTLPKDCECLSGLTDFCHAKGIVSQWHQNSPIKHIFSPPIGDLCRWESGKMVWDLFFTPIVSFLHTDSGCLHYLDFDVVGLDSTFIHRIWVSPSGRLVVC